ncbi:MAG: pseudouridine synthase [Lachnospiraceae bacterium]|nr:pseudouridine synthase [Lachnospiraceae bacterium]
MRINKYLAACGVSSRRGADRLIDEGRVTVDGRVAVKGDEVRDENVVALDGTVLKPRDRVVLAYNKPAGVVCSDRAQGKDDITVTDAVGYGERVFPIGRLDKESTGLLLLTNDGDLSDHIMRASHHHEKEYEVSVDKNVTTDFIDRMSRGVTITFEDGSTYDTRDCRVTKTGNRSFSIILTEGKNRQIRRMCKALGYRVVSLNRVRVMHIVLGGLTVGEYRRLDDKEVAGFLGEFRE